ncbi:MAG: replication factor C large subunit [Nanoarchaeota archaeon]|nr:replication factor C large subunit [Nanoarchaeota archaeon]
MKPWTVKYQPQNLSEIQGQNKSVLQLKSFVENFKKQRKKALIVYGNVGNGKTSAIYALARELDLELLEINASDVRNEEKINQIVGGALKQQSLFFKSKIILVDEADGIFGREDRGGVQALVALIKEAQFPLILTANNPWDKKFSTLRNYCEMLQFSKLRYTSVAKVLKKICSEEGIEYEDDALQSLARRADGDLRGAIIDLQSLAHDKKLTAEDLDNLDPRKQTETIINAIMRIFKTTDAQVSLEAADLIDENIDELFLWIDENLPKEYTQPHDLYRAYEKMSRADIFRRRIRRRQHWRYIVYIKSLLSAGISVSKDEKYRTFTRYGRTQRILKLWKAKQKNLKKLAIAEKIAGKTHCSVKDAVQGTLPYFKTMFKDKGMKKELIDEFNLSKEEVAWLRKN